MFQYVNETLQKLNERFNLYKTVFKHPLKNGYCKIVHDHFTQIICKGTKYWVQIIESIQGDVNNKRGAIDLSFA